MAQVALTKPKAHEAHRTLALPPLPSQAKQRSISSGEDPPLRALNAPPDGGTRCLAARSSWGCCRAAWGRSSPVLLPQPRHGPAAAGCCPLPPTLPSMATLLWKGKAENMNIGLFLPPRIEHWSDAHNLAEEDGHFSTSVARPGSNRGVGAVPNESDERGPAAGPRACKQGKPTGDATCQTQSQTIKGVTEEVTTPYGRFIPLHIILSFNHHEYLSLSPTPSSQASFL